MSSSVSHSVRGGWDAGDLDVLAEAAEAVPAYSAAARVVAAAAARSASAEARARSDPIREAIRAQVEEQLAPLQGRVSLLEKENEQHKVR